MNWKYPVFKIPLYIPLLAVCLLLPVSIANSMSVISFPVHIPEEDNNQKHTDEKESLDKLNILLRTHLESNDLEKGRRVAERIILKAGNNDTLEDDVIATSYYLVGVYYLLSKNYSETLRFLELAARSERTPQ